MTTFESVIGHSVGATAFIVLMSDFQSESARALDVMEPGSGRNECRVLPPSASPGMNVASAHVHHSEGGRWVHARLWCG